MYWFLDEMSWKKKSLENLQYNLDNWDGLAHLTRRTLHMQTGDTKKIF